MNRICKWLLLSLGLACGAQNDTERPVQLQPVPDDVRASIPWMSPGYHYSEPGYDWRISEDGETFTETIYDRFQLAPEIGSAAQALVADNGYGQTWEGANNAGADGRDGLECQTGPIPWKNPQNGGSATEGLCIVPFDRTVHFFNNAIVTFGNGHYTSGNYDFYNGVFNVWNEYNFATAAGWNLNPDLTGTSPDIVKLADVSSGNDRDALAGTARTGSSRLLSCVGTGSGCINGHYYIEYASCEIDLYPTNIAGQMNRVSDLTQRQNIGHNILLHEFGHCMGLGHSTSTNNIMATNTTANIMSLANIQKTWITDFRP